MRFDESLVAAGHSTKPLTQVKKQGNEVDEARSLLVSPPQSIRPKRSIPFEYAVIAFLESPGSP
jgi:hypothetical protein